MHRRPAPDLNSPVTPVTRTTRVVTHKGVAVDVVFESVWMDRDWSMQNVFMYLPDEDGICVGYVRLAGRHAATVAALYPTAFHYLKASRQFQYESEAALLAARPNSGPMLLEDAERELAALHLDADRWCVDYARVADGRDPRLEGNHQRRGILAATYPVIADWAAERGEALYSADTPSSEATPVWAWLEAHDHPVRRERRGSGMLRILDHRPASITRPAPRTARPSTPRAPRRRNRS